MSEGDVFSVLDVFDTDKEAAAIKEVGATESLPVILYFISVSTGDEYTVEVDVDGSDLQQGGLYDTVLSVWGRMIGYESLRFDKAVARADASFILATYKGLTRFVREIQERTAQEAA